MPKRRPSTRRSRCAAKPDAAARESCAPHRLAEPLAGELQPDHDQGGRQSEEQKAECGTLLPIEAGDELGIDLLGEPLRVLAAEERGSEIAAEREHENHDAAGGD